MSAFKGTSGDDNLTGSNGSDQFNLIQGGEDTASGLGGADTFTMHGTLDAGDAIDGGSGADTVSLSGDYSAGVTFSATTITNVERIVLGAGFDYKFTSDDATVAAGQTLTIDGAHLGAGDTLNFDGSAETDGKLGIGGGAGNDILKGGSAGAVFDLRAGGEDTATGGSGSDLFVVGGALDAGDHIDGGFSLGGSHDVLRIVGDYSAGLTLGAQTIQNIETLQFGAGFDYKFTVDNANFLSGPTALINAGGLGAGDSLNFDASASDANFHFIGGAGNDVLKGGTAGSYFDLSKGGDDTAMGGVRDDHFNLGGTFNAADSIDGGGGNDRVDITGLDGTDIVTFTATTMTGVESLILGAGHNYDLVTNDATVAAGATMLINGAGLGASDALTFDGSAETDGHFLIRGGAGDDNLTGGQDGDTFNLTKGGADSATGGAGNDTFNIGAAFDSDDQIDGGTGNDTLSIDGDYLPSLTVSGAMALNIDTVTLGAGHGYNITWQSAIGSSLTVDASAVGAGDTVLFDTTALATGNVHFIAGAGEVVFRGGAGDDVVDVQNNTDGFNVSGGDGDDTVNFGAVYGSNPFQSADGGTGSNTATFDGDYSAGVTVGPSVFFGPIGLRDFQTIELLGDHSYAMTFDDSQGGGATLTGGAGLTVDASALSASDQALLDFSLSQASGFTVTGGAGSDTVTFGANFANASGGDSTSNTIDGGGGNDTVVFNGGLDGVGILIAPPVDLVSGTFTNVETIKLEGTHSYGITIENGNIAAGATLTIDASGALDGESVGASNVTTGSLHFIAGTGVASFGGGANADIFDMAASTDSPQLNGGGGDDIINFGSNVAQIAQVNGNAGNDTLNIDGDYSGGQTLQGYDYDGVLTPKLLGIETVVFAAGHAYDIAINDDITNDASGNPDTTTLTINGSALAAPDTMTLDLSGATSTAYAVTGGAGDDVVKFGGNIAAADTFSGGAGNDTLELDGNYSAGYTFGAAQLTGVETLRLDDGFGYKLTTNDATVASGQTLTVDASALTGTNALTFDGSAETNGFFAVTGGAGDDTVKLGSHFSVSDAIDGGAGTDTVTLTNIHGTYNFTDTTIQNVEDLVITIADSSAGTIITTTDKNVAAGATMIVDFSHSGPLFGVNFTFDGSAEQDGHFNFIAPATVLSDISVTGGAQSDTFLLDHPASGTSRFHGLGGDDTATVKANISALQFDGGADNDTLAVTGGGSFNYAGGGGWVLTSVENLHLDDNGYFISLNDDNFGATETLNVDATALTGSHALTFNGTGSTLANYIFKFAGNFTASDSLTGGSGSDTLKLNGDYTSPLVMGASTIGAIETITVADGHIYDIVSNNANVASGATLTVDSSALTGGNTLSFSGSAELDGHFAFIAGAGADDLEGGSQSDTFDLSLSDGAFVNGGGGNDTFTVTSRAFLLDDFIDGGTGSTDTLVLNGNFSTATAITGSNLEDIDALTLLGAANSYNLAFTDGITTSLTVNASAAASLTFDATGDTATSFTIIGSAGNDTLTGGGLNDGFNLTGGGNDTAHGGAGNDTFSFGAAFTAADTVDGGANSDTISLSGDYSAGLTFSATSMTSVETLALNPGHSYNLTTNDANVASGATLNVFASSLGAGDTLTFDGAAETNGAFAITSGAGTNTLTGGGGNDTITLGSNFSTAADAIDGGTGSDTVNLVNVQGNYTFAATTIANVEDLAVTVTDGDSASFTTNDANVAAGATMIVDFSSSGTAFGVNTLTFDGSAETDGHFAFVEPNTVNIMALTGGALSDTLSFTHGDSGDNTFNGLGGDDTATTTANASRLDFNGGTGNDTLAFTGGGTENVDYLFTSVENVTFDDNNWTVNQRFDGAAVSLNVDATALSGGHTLTFNGVDTVDGLGLAEDSFVFEFAGNFISGDSLTGGAGNDTLSLDGDYSAGTTFGAAQLTSIEAITLAAGHSYNLTTNDANVASGATLTVNASALGSGNNLTFNGAAETNGSFIINAGAGNDTLTGGSQNDTFNMGANLTAADTINGGAGSDTVTLNGNYGGSHFLTFGASTMTNVETLTLEGFNTYDFTTNDATVASGATLTVNASGVLSLIFNGQAETDGSFSITTNAEEILVTGGAQADVFNLVGGGSSTVSGGGGNDAISLGASLSAGDEIDGGTGNDTVILNGNYSNLTFGADTMTRVETLSLGTGHSYNLTTNDATVASGATLTVDASALGASNTLTFDGSAETDGFFAITGGAGADSITLASRAVLLGSTIDGGAGSDTLTLNYANSTFTTLAANTITNVEKIVFDAATTNYVFASNDANVASGQTLTLDGSALTHSLNWDASAETNGFFDFIGGAGTDVFTVGSETVLGGSTVNGGGGGNNDLVLNGDFSTAFTFTAAEMTNIQTLTLDRNHSYDLTTIDANVASGGTLFVNGNPLVSTDTIRFDGSAETDGKFTIDGGQGHDTLIGGAGNDTIWGYNGADTMTGGAGADTFFYQVNVGAGVAESTSTHYDTITDMNFSVDQIDPPGANGVVTGVDTAIAGGALSTATFDTDLAAAVNASNLAVSHAVLFTADSGTLSGHTFLVVDENGTAGYQASADLVIDVTGYSGTLTTGSFT